MSIRTVGAANTRQSLLDAGLRLAEQTGLATLSVNLIVAEAGVSKGAFFHHFPDRSSYLLALHRGFYDGLLQRIEDAIEGLPPGRARLLAGAQACLDACLESRGVRPLLLEARAEPLVAAETRSCNSAVAGLCASDFVELGWQNPRESAQLWVGAVLEAALVELESARRRPPVRAALGQFLGAGAAT